MIVTPTDLKKTADRVFGKPADIRRETSLGQAFSTTMTLFSDWSTSVKGLTENDATFYIRIAAGHPKPSHVPSPVWHALKKMEFANIAYNTLINQVLGTDTEAAHAVLDRFQTAYKTPIEFLNQSKYLKDLSASSGTDHHQQGSARQHQPAPGRT